MNPTQDKAASLWRKSRKPNLRIYTPTGVYFIHAKINGRLVRGSLGTDIESVAELLRDKRLKEEHKSESLASKGADPNQTVQHYLDVYRRNVEGSDLKPRSRAYK